MADVRLSNLKTGARMPQKLWPLIAVAAALSLSATSSPTAEGAGCEPSYYPSLLAVGPHGTLYLGERVWFQGGGCVERPATASYVIVKRTRTGSTSVIAGETAKQGRPIPGRATASPLWEEPEAGAVDSDGNLYVLDDDAVLKITPGGRLSVVAGELGKSGRPAPGEATQSRFYDPTAIAVDGNHNLYIADSYNDVVEKVTPQGQLSILAGQVRTDSPPIPGPAFQSTLGYPDALAVDEAGDMYVASGAGNETVGRYISEISPQGTLSVVAGDGSWGVPTQGVQAVDSPLDAVWGMAIGRSRPLYLVTTTNFAAASVFALSASGTVTHVAGSVYGRGKPTGLPAACGRLEGGYSHWSVLPLQFDSAGNAYMDADANSVDGCVVEVTPQGKLFVLGRTYTK